MKRIFNFIRFVGKKVSILIVADFFLGILWFIVESGFLVVFQGFLISISLVNFESLKLPDWYPSSLLSNLIILSFYGLLRAFLSGAKKVVPTLAAETFAFEQRKNILCSTFFSNQKKSTSEILGSFGELSNKASQFILHGTNVLSSLAIIFLMFVLSLKLAWAETLLGSGLLFLVMLPLKVLNKRIRKNGEGVVTEWGRVNKLLVEGIKNLFLLKLYDLTNVEFDKGVSQLKRYENHRNQYLYSSAVISSAPLFLGMLIISVISFFSKNFFSTSPLSFIGFLYLFMRLAQNLSQLNTSISSALFYKDSFSILYLNSEDYAEEPSATQLVKASAIDRRPVRVEVSNVNFKYKEGKEVIRELSFSLWEGKLLLLKGPSGVGKSTIIKLIAGLEIPTSGVVTLNGTEPRSFVKSNSQLVAYVGPEPFLIAGTVKENLLYGNSLPITDEEIWKVLDSFGMASVVESFPRGLDESLFEDAQLSTGQKQRLSFARAILRQPSLMILDEATANIDYQTESVIVKQLQSLKGAVTIVAISHRDSFDLLCDLKMEFRANENWVSA